MQALPVAEKVEHGAAVPPARARGRLERGAAVRHAGRGGRRAADDRRRRHPRLRLPVPAGRAGRVRPALAEKAVKDAFKKATSRSVASPTCSAKLRAVVAARGAVHPRHAEDRDGGTREAEGAKAGPLSQVLRVATTGKEVGFSAYDTLAILGRDRCLARDRPGVMPIPEARDSPIRRQRPVADDLTPRSPLRDTVRPRRIMAKPLHDCRTPRTLRREERQARRAGARTSSRTSSRSTTAPGGSAGASTRGSRRSPTATCTSGTPSRSA